MTDTITQRITRTPGVCGGKACVAGTRIRVMDILLWHEQGATVDEIAGHYPSLSLSDIHTALAYYHDHPEEIRDDIRRNDEVAAALKPRFPSPLAEKLGRGTG
jgi:uncharacterized protein (DUF433 family)